MWSAVFLKRNCYRKTVTIQIPRDIVADHRSHTLAEIVSPQRGFRLRIGIIGGPCECSIEPPGSSSHGVI